VLHRLALSAAAQEANGAPLPDASAASSNSVVGFQAGTTGSGGHSASDRFLLHATSVEPRTVQCRCYLTTDLHTVFSSFQVRAVVPDSAWSPYFDMLLPRCDVHVAADDYVGSSATAERDLFLVLQWRAGCRFYPNYRVRQSGGQEEEQGQRRAGGPGVSGKNKNQVLRVLVQAKFRAADGACGVARVVSMLNVKECVCPVGRGILLVDNSLRLLVCPRKRRRSPPTESLHLFLRRRKRPFSLRACRPS